MAPPVKGELSDNEKKLTELVNDGKVEEVKALLGEKDVRVDCLDGSGMTPLQHAAYRGHAEICRLLLSHGADVNSNYHEHGYTALIFGALSGKRETVRILLQAGAKTYHTNSVGRTASQMAGFVGQHQVVSLINNFISREDLEYYTVARALEKEPKMPPHLAGPLFSLLNQSNLNPVKISMGLQKHLDILDDSYKVNKVLELLLAKNMKSHDTNEIMAMKFHYFSTLIGHADKSRQENNGKLDAWIKSLLRGREPDGFPEAQERMIRAMFKAFPYVESQLLHQMVRSLANVPVGGNPTALNILNQGINGQRFGSEDDEFCATCDELNASKKCSACKMVNYCNQECQKLHWFTHKKFCKRLAEEFVQIQERKRLYEEQKKREEEEKAKAEALKAEEDKKNAESKNQDTSEGKVEGEGEGGEKVDKETGDQDDGVTDVTEKLQKISTEPDTKSSEGEQNQGGAERSVSMSDVNVNV